MAYRTLYFRKDDGSKLNHYYIFDTASELLNANLVTGDIAYTVDTGAFYIAGSTTTWSVVTGSSATINSLTDVVNATNEYVLTKDTATGNAIFKAPQGGSLTDSGTTVYLTNTTDEFVVGGVSPLSSAKFSIDGDTDQIQTVIQGYSTQTGNILEVQKSDATVMLGVSTSGITVGGSTASMTSVGGVQINIQPRITTIASSATPTINTDNCDAVTITALALAITSMTTNLSGTMLNFQQLIIRFKDDGTGRAITWGASFASRGATLPTTTVANKVTTVRLLGNTVAAVWDCVHAVTEA